MKKIGLSVAIALLAFCGKKPESIQNAASNDKYVKVKDGLNVRETPELNGKRITTLANGTKVTVLETKSELFNVGEVRGNWTKISDGKIHGWAFGGFLSSDPITPESNGSGCGAVKMQYDECMRRCMHQYKNDEITIGMKIGFCEEGGGDGNGCVPLAAENRKCGNKGYQW